MNKYRARLKVLGNSESAVINGVHLTKKWTYLNECGVEKVMKFKDVDVQIFNQDANDYTSLEKPETRKADEVVVSESQTEIFDDANADEVANADDTEANETADVDTVSENAFDFDNMSNSELRNFLMQHNYTETELRGIPKAKLIEMAKATEDDVDGIVYGN